MNQVTVTLPDGSTKQVESGAPVKAVAEAISPRLADAALAAFVDDKMVDLTYPLTEDATVRIVTNKSPEALELYRHSTAHLLAAAVTALFPKVQCGIGPPIEDGFYYDFIVERPFVPEDLEAIEAKMKELASKDYVYERQLWPRQEAIDFFTKRGEPLKVQLIEEKTAGQPEVSVYTIKDKDTFLDFCVGPHVPSTGRLKAFKLTSTSNAYWKGDAKNAPMQRVYGTAFFSQKELDEHLARLEEAKKRDHRKLGKELGSVSRSTRWRPAPRSGRRAARRSTTRSSTSCAARQKAGFQEIKTPLALQQDAVGDVRALGQLPGEHVPRAEQRDQRARHGPQADELPVASSALRQRRSGRYRELPLRFRDASTCCTATKLSGALSGLTRVRQFAQDDCHVYLREDQIADEVKFLMDFILGHYEAFGLEATRQVRDAARDSASATMRCGIAPRRRSGARSKRPGRPYTLNDGDGAFYGPKIDFDVTDSLGRKWQLRHDPARLRRARALRSELRRATTTPSIGRS